MDAVRTEVMRNRFAAIAAEASYIAYRSAHTTFVKQTQDYQVALANIDGEFFAFPTRSGTTSGIGQNVRGLVDEIGIDKLVPGDIIITNDPYSGNALCTHSMDVHLIRPIFRDGRLIAFAWSFIHASDIGGSVPGSINPTNYEIFQEGIRIKPTLLYHAGELNEQLWSIFADNSRIPELIWGDLQAMLSGLALLDERTQELCDRYGVEELLESVRDVLDLAEERSRAVLRSLRDGTYHFNDYLEGYRGGSHIFISVQLTIRDGTARVDYTGSDPQVNYSMNFPSSSGRPHPYLCMPLIHYILTTDPNIPVNGGLVRPIQTFAPRGTIMNSQFPAAGGNRAVTFNRIYDVVLGCLDQAVPGGVSAAGSGMAGIISVASMDMRTGRRHVSVVEPFIGGSGARKSADGVDGLNMTTAFLKSAPIETVELETSLVVRQFAFERDSAGPGRFRGGSALRIEMENRGAPAVITVRGIDRFEFRPWGLAGGACGQHGRVVLNHGTAEEREIGKLEVLEMQPGDVLLMITPSGGGYGSPLDRPVQQVADDVKDDVISGAAAREVYGVICNGDGVDDIATTRRRASLAATNDALFSFGEARKTLERQWPPTVSAFLAKTLLGVPSGLSRHMLERVRRELKSHDGPITEASVVAACEKLGLNGAPPAALPA